MCHGENTKRESSKQQEIVKPILAVVWEEWEREDFSQKAAFMTVPKQLDLPRIRNFQAERANTYEEPKAAKRWNWSQSKQINMITVATSGVERDSWGWWCKQRPLWAMWGIQGESTISDGEAVWHYRIS